MADTAQPAPAPVPERRRGLGGALLHVAHSKAWGKLRGAVKGMQRIFALAKQDEQEFLASSEAALHDAETGESGVQLAVDSKKDLAKINYLLQGNAALYTPEALERRHDVRTDPRLINAIKAWWQWMPKGDGQKTHASRPMTAGAAARQDGIVQPVYMAMVVLMQLVLLPKFNCKPDQDYDPSEDWEADSKGADMMYYPDFFDALFELADMWCDGVDAGQYSALLYGLLADAKGLEDKRTTFTKLLKKFGWPPKEAPKPEPAPAPARAPPPPPPKPKTPPPDPPPARTRSPPAAEPDPPVPRRYRSARVVVEREPAYQPPAYTPQNFYPPKDAPIQASWDPPKLNSGTLGDVPTSAGGPGTWQQEHMAKLMAKKQLQQQQKNKHLQELRQQQKEHELKHLQQVQQQQQQLLQQRPASTASQQRAGGTPEPALTDLVPGLSSLINHLGSHDGRAAEHVAAEHEQAAAEGAAGGAPGHTLLFDRGESRLRLRPACCELELDRAPPSPSSSPFSSPVGGTMRVLRSPRYDPAGAAASGQLSWPASPGSPLQASPQPRSPIGSNRPGTGGDAPWAAGATAGARPGSWRGQARAGHVPGGAAVSLASPSLARRASSRQARPHLARHATVGNGASGRRQPQHELERPYTAPAAADRGNVGRYGGGQRHSHSVILELPGHERRGPAPQEDGGDEEGARGEDGQPGSPRDTAAQRPHTVPDPTLGSGDDAGRAGSGTPWWASMTGPNAAAQQYRRGFLTQQQTSPLSAHHMEMTGGSPLSPREQQPQVLILQPAAPPLHAPQWALPAHAAPAAMDDAPPPPLQPHGAARGANKPHPQHPQHHHASHGSSSSVGSALSPRPSAQEPSAARARSPQQQRPHAATTAAAKQGPPAQHVTAAGQAAAAAGPDTAPATDQQDSNRQSSSPVRVLQPEPLVSTQGPPLCSNTARSMLQPMRIIPIHTLGGQSGAPSLTIVRTVAMAHGLSLKQASALWDRQQEAAEKLVSGMGRLAFGPLVEAVRSGQMPPG